MTDSAAARRQGLLNMIATRDGVDWSLAIVHRAELPDESQIAAIRAFQEQSGASPS